MTVLSASTDTSADELLLRVLGALIREDIMGLRTRGRISQRSDGLWLSSHTDDGTTLSVPVTEDGFQSWYRARLPLLRLEEGELSESDLVTAEAVLHALTPLADPEDRDGFVAFTEECRQTLATVRLHEAARPAIMARLTSLHGDDPAGWTGLTGGLAHDALAALTDHPVYPSGRGRAGLSDDDIRAYSPEFHRPFALRWLLLPRDVLTPSTEYGPALAGLPTAGELGFEGYDESHLPLPLHPLSAGPPLQQALHECGLLEQSVLVTRPFLDVLPTLSMRTVARTDRAHEHLKLPLATSTLGMRNRRTIKPGTLLDGLAGQRLLGTIIAREPRLRDRVLLADETDFAHAGHDLLAVLVRRYPSVLDRSVVVPLAALLAQAPHGELVAQHLANRFFDGDPLRLLDEMLALLFDLQVTLFTYGIALESHQQNVSLVLDEGQPPKLLLKDNDGPRINRRRLGQHGLAPVGFEDPRIITEDDGPLIDVFATITVHLCAGAFAFGLARRGIAPLPRLLTLVRDRLAEAIDRAGADGLRVGVLEADQLPVKAMVTAGTLLTKERSGAVDVNKHYTTGPNYLMGVAP